MPRMSPIPPISVALLSRGGVLAVLGLPMCLVAWRVVRAHASPSAVILPASGMSLVVAALVRRQHGR